MPGARTVLVVEDEPHIRDLVALHLGLEGWTAECVGDGHDALERLRAEAATTWSSSTSCCRASTA